MLLLSSFTLTHIFFALIFLCALFLFVRRSLLQALNLPLHILVNNAALLLQKQEGQTTVDGYELHFGVNYLGVEGGRGRGSGEGERRRNEKGEEGGRREHSEKKR